MDDADKPVVEDSRRREIACKREDVQKFYEEVGIKKRQRVWRREMWAAGKEFDKVFAESQAST